MKIFIWEQNNHLNEEIFDDEKYKLKNEDNSKNSHEKSVLTSKDRIDSIHYILIASQKSKEDGITSFRDDEHQNWEGEEEIINFAEEEVRCIGLTTNFYFLFLFGLTQLMDHSFLRWLHCMLGHFSFWSQTEHTPSSSLFVEFLLLLLVFNHIFLFICFLLLFWKLEFLQLFFQILRFVLVGNFSIFHDQNLITIK